MKQAAEYTIYEPQREKEKGKEVSQTQEATVAVDRSVGVWEDEEAPILHCNVCRSLVHLGFVNAM